MEYFRRPEKIISRTNQIVQDLSAKEFPPIKDVPAPARYVLTFKSRKYTNQGRERGAPEDVDTWLGPSSCSVTTCMRELYRRRRKKVYDTKPRN